MIHDINQLLAAPIAVNLITSLVAADEFDSMYNFLNFTILGIFWTYMGLFVWLVPIVFMAGNIVFGWIFSGDAPITVWLIEHYVSNFGLLFHILAVGYGILDVIDALPHGADLGDFGGATVTYTLIYTCFAIFYER